MEKWLLVVINWFRSSSRYLPDEIPVFTGFVRPI